MEPALIESQVSSWGEEKEGGRRFEGEVNG